MPARCGGEPFEERDRAGAAEWLRTLVVRARDSDERAFEELHRRLSPALRDFFRSRVGLDGEVVDELTQRAWIAVWRGISSGRYDVTRSSITTYAYAVASKVWLQSGRQSRSAFASGGVGDATEIFARIADTSDNPSDAIDAAVILDAVVECMNVRLSDEDRRLLLALVGGESERAVAARFGLSASTVNARKHVALVKLRACLAGKGFRVPPERGGDERE